MRSNSAPSACGSGPVYSTNSNPSVPIGLSQRSRRGGVPVRAACAVVIGTSDRTPVAADVVAPRLFAKNNCSRCPGGTLELATERAGTANDDARSAGQWAPGLLPSRLAVGERLPPHLFEIVVGADFRSEHVNDHVARIDQHPVSLSLAL